MRSIVIVLRVSVFMERLSNGPLFSKRLISISHMDTMTSFGMTLARKLRDTNYRVKLVVRIVGARLWMKGGI